MSGLAEDNGVAAALSDICGETPSRVRPFERKADKRNAPLWRPMDSEDLEINEPVVLLISNDGDEAYVTSAYFSGSRWLCAHSATPINGRKIGWMPMRAAICALAAARGGAK